MKCLWIILAVVVIGCAILSLGLIAGFIVYPWVNVSPTSPAQAIASPLPTFTKPAAKPARQTEGAPATSPTPPSIEEKPTAIPGKNFQVPTDTLETLRNTIVPINDPLALARQLEGKENLPISLNFPVNTYQVGDQKSFWVMNSDDNRNRQVQATLQYIGEHVYFWVQQGTRYNERHLKNLVDAFDKHIYPTNRAFFGSEWNPGVDADPRLYILYTQGLGGNVAGYFSTVDEYLPEARQYSNGHEMFLISADHVGLQDEFAYGVLAHEFQHMIHWYRDRNEETWMNEGFSNLAMLLNGYDIGGADRAYIANPDMQLNDWPTDSPRRDAHYGAAFLFLTYFLDRFGDEATQALVAEPDNGMSSIDKVLASQAASDPLTNKIMRADDVFADWVLASFLKDAQVADGRYTYRNYPKAPQASITEKLDDCPMQASVREVSQYGVDYIQIQCKGNYRLRFEGSLQVGVLPENPYSGKYAFYSNRGDESHMTLSRSFDFSGYSGPLTLSYWTWYDLEKDYDYVHLTASLDGENWQILTTPSGTAEDPSGNSYGWGYNGTSGGGKPEWIEERVDLSQFAGEQVQLRFHYITDAAVNGEGFLVDNIAIPEINYFTDLETDDGGWQAEGFVRIQNILPQTFQLSLIQFGDQTQVERIDLPANNVVDVPLGFNNGIKKIVLVVSGSMPFTRQKAQYQISIFR